MIRIFEALRARGYDGGYDAIRRYAASRRSEEREASVAAYVPLTFDPGGSCQFDWRHEIVVIDGATTTEKVAHVRLCHGRIPFVRADPRATQEMVFDAHAKAFAFFGGACTRGICDNINTAADTIFVGRDLACNRYSVDARGPRRSPGTQGRSALPPRRPDPRRARIPHQAFVPEAPATGPAA